MRQNSPRKVFYTLRFFLMTLCANLRYRRKAGLALRKTFCVIKFLGINNLPLLSQGHKVFLLLLSKKNKGLKSPLKP
jgi:hypothetical protein